MHKHCFNPNCDCDCKLCIKAMAGRKRRKETPEETFQKEMAFHYKQLAKVSNILDKIL